MVPFYAYYSESAFTLSQPARILMDEMISFIITLIEISIRRT